MAGLPPDFEIALEWDVCLASITRPAAQKRIRMLMERDFTGRVMSKTAWDITSANSGAKRPKGEYQCHTVPQVPTLGFRAGMPDWT
jgi:hypothetical protein